MPSAAVRDVAAARKALDEEHADLVIVDREPGGGLDGPGVCRALRKDHRLDESWLLAITVAAQKRTADAALDAGADDYLHRPFSRAELLARARAGLRAAQQRADDALVRALMANVPGAIYRSAWHADFTLELISDEIERISGYPAANFIASKQAHADEHPAPGRPRRASTRRCRRRPSDGPFALEYRIIRADGEIRWVLDRGHLVSGGGGRLWCDGAIFDITDRRARRGGAAPPRDRGGPHRGAARVARSASSRRPTRPAAGSSATCTTARSSGSSRSGSRCGWPARASRRTRAARPTCSSRIGDRARRGVGRAARAGPRHPPRRAHRARPGARDRRARRPRAGARRHRSSCRRSASRPPPRRPPTSRSPRRSPTSPSTRTPRTQRSASRAENGDLAIEVQDDGKGGAEAAPGSGLAGLADRVGALDGVLEVTSPPGEGTLLRAVLPL